MKSLEDVRTQKRTAGEIIQTINAMDGAMTNKSIFTFPSSALLFPTSLASTTLPGQEGKPRACAHTISPISNCGLILCTWGLSKYSRLSFVLGGKELVSTGKYGSCLMVWAAKIQQTTYFTNYKQEPFTVVWKNFFQNIPHFLLTVRYFVFVIWNISIINRMRLVLVSNCLNFIRTWLVFRWVAHWFGK